MCEPNICQLNWLIKWNNKSRAVLRRRYMGQHTWRAGLYYGSGFKAFIISSTLAKQMIGKCLFVFLYLCLNINFVPRQRQVKAVSPWVMERSYSSLNTTKEMAGLGYGVKTTWKKGLCRRLTSSVRSFPTVNSPSLCECSFQFSTNTLCRSETVTEFTVWGAVKKPWNSWSAG